MGYIWLPIVLGLLPAAIARGKGYNFLGWWIFGALLFIVALPVAIFMKRNQAVLDARAIGSGDVKRCPHCAEMVRPAAVVCKHCGRDLPAPLQAVV